MGKKESKKGTRGKPFEKGHSMNKKVTPEGKEAFLHILERTGSPSEAARLFNADLPLTARVSLNTWYNHKTRDGNFSEQWDAIMDADLAALEAQAKRWAIDGEKSVVVQGGRVVYDRNDDGTLRLDDAGNPIPIIETKKSEKLLMFLLERRYASKYALQRKVELESKGGIALLPPGTSAEDWMKEFGKASDG